MIAAILAFFATLLHRHLRALTTNNKIFTILCSRRDDIPSIIRTLHFYHDPPLYCPCLQHPPPHPPVTRVFASATSGLGESALRALAANSTAPRVYITDCGEPRTAAIIEDCLKIYPGGTFIFLSADLSLLKNVDTVCREILKREEGGKLDLLFMTYGYITFEGMRGNGEAPFSPHPYRRVS